TSKPYADRFSPVSRSSQRDSLSRPDTMTRAPLVSDSTTCSARSRQTVQFKNSGSPSRHSPDALSNVRGVDAMANLATATPDGVTRISGSPHRLPIAVMVVSFIAGASLGSGQAAAGTAAGVGSAG